jgi:hypothetical protein
MKKHNAQNALRFLFLICIAFSSGCAQSTVTNTPMSTLQPTQTLTVINTPISTPTLPIPTATLIPCNPSSQSLETDIEKAAQEWFISVDSPMLGRNEYKAYSEWSKFCEIYNQNVLNNKPSIKDPIALAMLIAGYPNIDGVAPSSVTVFYGYSNPDIVSVTIISKNLMDDGIRDSDNRIDLVNVNGIWQIQWIGFRLHCRRNHNENWVTSPCP